MWMNTEKKDGENLSHITVFFTLSKTKNYSFFRTKLLLTEIRNRMFWLRVCQIK